MIQNPEATTHETDPLIGRTISHYTIQSRLGEDAAGILYQARDNEAAKEIIFKALHLDEMFGSKAGGCKPGATIEKLDSRYKAVQRWNANRKLGQPMRILFVGRLCGQKNLPLLFDALKALRASRM